VKDICDDIFLGEATQDNTLDGLCDNIHTGNTHLPSVLDLVSSCLFSRSKNYRSLSYMLGSRLAGELLLPFPLIRSCLVKANMNLLKRAEAAGVKHFVFVSVLSGDKVIIHLIPDEWFILSHVHSLEAEYLK
jgi:hypothetical protein